MVRGRLHLGQMFHHYQVKKKMRKNKKRTKLKRVKTK